jgi:hypothetical protein
MNHSGTRKAFAVLALSAQRVSDEQPSPALTFCYIMPGNGSIDRNLMVGAGAGCAVALSPSAQYLMYSQGGEHITLYVDDWANTNPDIHVLDGTSVTVNRWAGNKYAAFRTSCPDWGGTVVVGMGMTCNRWSCNSDKWLSLCMGWPDGGSGRYCECGTIHESLRWAVVDSLSNVLRNYSVVSDSCKVKVHTPYDKDSLGVEYQALSDGRFSIAR